MVFPIVIPVLNGEKYIGKCIDSIRNLEPSDIYIDIFVIDNGSTDLTIDILQRKKVNYIICKDINLSRMRNLGASQVSGEFIGFVDSDCLVDKNWMLEAISILSGDNKIGVVGRFYDVGENPTWIELAWFTRRKEIEGPVDFIPAGNMVIRKKIFDSIGGFSEKIITGEDYELCQRIRGNGYSIINTSRVNVKHLGNAKTLCEIIKKERWYALGMLSTLSSRSISKPLLVCLVFIALVFGIATSLLINVKLFAIMLLCLLIFLVIVSIQFIKDVTKNRLILAMKFIPISLSYVIGRSLGLMDLVILKIKTNNRITVQR